MAYYVMRKIPFTLRNVIRFVSLCLKHSNQTGEISMSDIQKKEMRSSLVSVENHALFALYKNYFEDFCYSCKYGDLDFAQYANDVMAIIEGVLADRGVAFNKY